MKRVLPFYAIFISLLLIFAIVEISKLTEENKRLSDGVNESNEKILYTLRQENAEIKSKYENLKHEKDYLERKVKILMENNNDELIEELENEIQELEKLVDKLSGEVKEYKYKYEETYDKWLGVVEAYNQEVLGIVDILYMNPEIFKQDETTKLIDPQYALNVIKINRQDAVSYGRLQSILYDATGIHEPEEAVRYLLKQGAQ